jgi:hypothetical protein
MCLTTNLYQSNSSKKLYQKWGNPKEMRMELQELIHNLMSTDNNGAH